MLIPRSPKMNMDLLGSLACHRSPCVPVNRRRARRFWLRTGPTGRWCGSPASGRRSADSASGLFSTAQQVGGAIGSAVVGTAYFGYLGSHSFTAAFTHTAPCAAVAFLICAALSLALPKTAVADGHG